jgi:hypothetical protein
VICATPPWTSYKISLYETAATASGFAPVSALGVLAGADSDEGLLLFSSEPVLMAALYQSTSNSRRDFVFSSRLGPSRAYFARRDESAD